MNKISTAFLNLATCIVTFDSGMMMTKTISKACEECFVDMLRSNYVMENFVLFQRFPVKPEFKLYVTLNKLGRGQLLQAEETNMEDWIQTLATVNDDLDALFYYVSINPDLCTFALQRMQKKGSKTAKKGPDNNDRPLKRPRTQSTIAQKVNGIPTFCISQL